MSDKIPDTTVTAKDLLEKILDYNYLWSMPDRKHSKPAAIRLSQIEALQDAFGLTKKYVNPLVRISYSLSGAREEIERAQHLNGLTNLKYLLQGEFLHDREEGANAELTERVMQKCIELYPDLADDVRRKRSADISWLFNNLFHFRQEVYKVTYPGGGMLEGFSAGLHYSFYLQQQLKNVIRDHLAEIDETLCLVLDPAKRIFDKKQINYPEADLKDIDREWYMDNY